MPSMTEAGSRVDARTPAGGRLVKAIEAKVAQVQRSHQSLERELGWDRGTVRRLLAGKVEVTLRHIEQLAPVLGTSPFELLRGAYAEPPASAEELEPGWLDILSYQATALEGMGEVFQQLQALIPRPTLEEVGEMRSGKRPVTRFAFLIAQLQAYMCDVENVSSDLRIDLEYQFDPEGAEKLDNFFNALSTAVERLTPACGESEDA